MVGFLRFQYTSFLINSTLRVIWIVFGSYLDRVLVFLDILVWYRLYTKLRVSTFFVSCCMVQIVHKATGVNVFVSCLWYRMYTKLRASPLFSRTQRQEKNKNRSSRKRKNSHDGASFSTVISPLPSLHITNNGINICRIRVCSTPVTLVFLDDLLNKVRRHFELLVLTFALTFTLTFNFH